MTALLDHAADLPVAAEVRPEVAAIEQNRGLLADPDPVPGHRREADGGVAVGAQRGPRRLHLGSRGRAGVPRSLGDLAEAHPGAAVRPARRRAGRGSCRRSPWGRPRRSWTPSGRPKLSELRAIGDALPTRFSNALAAAAKLLEPKAQHVKLAGWYDQERGRPEVLAEVGGRPDPREAEGRSRDPLTSRREIIVHARRWRSDLRRQLENVVVQARDLAEAAARASLEAVGGRCRRAVRALLGGGQGRSATGCAPEGGRRGTGGTRRRRPRRSTSSPRNSPTNTGTGCSSPGSWPRTTC